jgi:hypothetical protein
MTPRLRQRLTCSGAAIALGIAAVLANRAAEGARLVAGPGDWLILIVASALVGALLLSRFVAPRRRNWLWPLIGGLLSAAAVVTLALLPDALLRFAAGRSSLSDALFALLLGALYAIVVAGPVFSLGALLLHALIRVAR